MTPGGGGRRAGEQLSRQNGVMSGEHGAVTAEARAVVTRNHPSAGYGDKKPGRCPSCEAPLQLHLPPVSMRAHLHMQLSLSMSLVLKSAPWITRLLCRPAVPLWLFRNSLKNIRREEEEDEEEEGGRT